MVMSHKYSYRPHRLLLGDLRYIANKALALAPYLEFILELISFNCVIISSYLILKVLGNK